MTLYSPLRHYRRYPRRSRTPRALRWFAAVVLLLLSLLPLFAGCASQSAETERGTAHSEAAFTLPDIPPLLVTSEARASYLAAYYWQGFNFRDTALISRPEVTEQALADFLDILSRVPLAEAQSSLTAMMDSAAVDSAMYAHFMKLSGKYLYEPNSPFRNEEYYIPVLRHVIASPRLGEPDKARPRFRLDMALKNRPGDVAADFAYTLANGTVGSLRQIKSSYTLLFFNSPDCEDCRRVKDYMAASEHLAGMTGEGSARRPRLVILESYPDEDVEQWRAAAYPPCMLNARDASQAINRHRLYDLKAVPCLYLLDADKRVLLKDVTVEHVELYLREHARN